MAIPSSNRVIINVGGTRYETYRTTLKTIPDTRLSWLTESKTHNSDCDPMTGEYFFDRHPGVFNMILNYYRTGKLHAPTDVCGPLFEEELTFWGIDEKQIEPCCWSTYRAHREAQETLTEIDGSDPANNNDDQSIFDEEVAERFGIVPDVTKIKGKGWAHWKTRLWNLLEYPHTTRAARVLAIISLVFVLFSICAFCLETHIEFRYVSVANVSLDTITTVFETQRDTTPYMFLDVIEYTCIAYFTLEIVARFIFCPSKIQYLKQPLNWVDFSSLVPFYTRQIVVRIDPSSVDSVGLYYLNSLRLIRIFRILKLSRHVHGLKILVQTIKASAKELLLLILVLGIGVLIFACLIYYAEQIADKGQNDFKSIPIGFWWAVVTMTTLGYGDMHPRTPLGYIVGAICALCGVLMLALPIPVIVNNFTLYYSHAQARMKLPKKTKNILVGAADALKQQTYLPHSSLDGSTASTSIESPVHTCNNNNTSTDSDRCANTINVKPVNTYKGRINIIYTDELAESTFSSRSPSPVLSPVFTKNHKRMPTRRQSLLSMGKRA